MSPRDILCALVVALCWGGNFAAVKLAMGHFPPLYMAALRFGLVTVLLLPYLPKLPRKHLWNTLLISITLGTLHFSLVFVAMYNGLDVSTTAVLVQLGVPFSCILGAIFLNDHLGWRRSMGLAIAFSGVVIIFGTPKMEGNYGAFALATLGCLCWSIANIQIKKMGKITIMPLLAWVSLFCFPQLLVISLVMEHDHGELLRTVDWLAAGGVIYSAVLSTIVAYGLWYHLLGKHPVSLVAPYNLLVPIFGMLSGVFLLGEEVGPMFGIGTAVTILGVGIIIFRQPRVTRI